ncbi:MAG: SpoIID/LytB domain-containing protein [Microgenomates group bacterium]
MKRSLPAKLALGLGIILVLGQISNFFSGVRFSPYAGIFSIVQQANADEVIELQQQIDELEHLKKLSEDATKPLETQVSDLENRINNARAGVARAKAEGVEVAKQIDTREKDLATQYEILSRRIFEQYKKLRTNSDFLLIFSNHDAAELTKDLAYRNSVKAQDNKLIQTIGADIAVLEQDKAKLERDQITLAGLEKQLDTQATFFRGEIGKAKDYQEDLGGKIAELSARQTEIINSRSGGFTVSGDSELADDRLASIVGFREGAPSGHFAVFSFGAYSHRNGMSQYGALGRAKSGQNYQQILNAYYPGTSIKTDYPAMSQITVDGHGTDSFEDWYLQRIYEVPASWPKEVLKAQAIAARTYAIKRTDNGQSSICTTEKCQVFKNSPKGGAWEEAVKETRGMVLVDSGGSPVSTQYASTHGGWTKTAGWDTTDGSGGSSFLDKAYEKIGGSPWLYKAWWREGYSSSGSTCGRSNPWLSPEEMADIVNAHLVITKGTSSDAERIAPVTTDCWGGNPYGIGELRDVASKYGGISSANSVSVTQGNGSTSSVTINGVSMSGVEFCKAFNLRAPGNMRIPQWSGSACGGAFFNIEKK